MRTFVKISTYGFSLLAVLFSLHQAVPAADIVPNEVMMPGTQPNEVQNFESPDKCDNCHGGFDEGRVWSNEPAFGWRGGAMGNAGRDPIFWATLAVAEQDFDGAGDLCIRCHSAAGWFAGRSTPTDGSGLAAGDDDGIDCDTCHKATNPDNSDPVLQGVVNPDFEPYDLLTGEGYYGSGILSVWGRNDKLGPYDNAEARHQFIQSSFHRGDICGSCHDVSNPVVGDLAPNNGVQLGAPVPVSSGGNYGGPYQEKAAFNNPPYAYGVVERTFSEYKAGGIDDKLVTEFSTLPADLQVPGGALAFAYNAAMQAGGTYEDGTDRYFNCQGCHMRPDVGVGCNKNGVPIRTDLPKHDQSGGNYWMWPLIQYQDREGTLRMGGGLTQTQIDAMDAGRQRAEQQLQMAASLVVDGNDVVITNLTGHKLITGYPEGRRMWLNVKWYDNSTNPPTLVREDGEYGPLDVTFANPRNEAQTFEPQSLTDPYDPYTRVYQAHYAMTQSWAKVLQGLHPDTLELSYDRYTGQPDFTLGDLAALPNPDDYHETFHFALNNYVAADNRIPPFGMKYDEAQQRNALPVPADQYGGVPGGTYDYKDVFTLTPEPGADYADVTLFYQGTSWEYILFLWKGNNEQNAFLGQEGINMLDAWLNADPAAPMVPPFVMAKATWGSSTCTPTEQTEITCDDGIDNDCDGLVDGADPDCAGCTPASATDTTCDGIDDDCNGLIDDGYVPLTTYCGLGVCEAMGELVCVDGSVVDTCTAGDPLPEGPFGDLTCEDLLDNDCDSFVDGADADCQAVTDCSMYPDRNACRADPVCQWKKNACVNR